MITDEDGIFRHGTEYITINDWDNFELDDYEHSEHGIGGIYSETTYKWKGKVKTSVGEIEVEINDFSCTDNGGVGVEIKSKPKGVNKGLWEQFEYYLENFIKDKYDRNEWLQSVRF